MNRAKWISKEGGAHADLVSRPQGLPFTGNEDLLGFVFVVKAVDTNLVIVVVSVNPHVDWVVLDDVFISIGGDDDPGVGKFRIEVHPAVHVVKGDRAGQVIEPDKGPGFCSLGVNLTVFTDCKAAHVIKNGFHVNNLVVSNFLHGFD